MKNKEIKKRLELLKDEITDLQGQLDEKPKHEIGKWYKTKIDEYLFCLTHTDLSHNLCGYGLDGLEWTNSGKWCYDSHIDKEATNNEVKARLIEYWEKDNEAFDSYYLFKNELRGGDYNDSVWTTLLNDKGEWVHSAPKRRELTVKQAETEFNIKIKK